MMVTRKFAISIIKNYRKAWIRKDSQLILSIFPKNGKYHEYVLEKPFIGHKEIKNYWEKKVISTQKNIKFKLLNLYIDGDMVIAECYASFYDIPRKITIHMKLLLLLKIKGKKISYLREYWSSQHFKNGIKIEK